MSDPRISHTTYDTTAPTVSIQIEDSGGYTNDATPLINIATGDIDIDEMRFKLDAGTWSGWIPYAISHDAFDISTGGDGEKTVWAEFKDNAGNISVPVFDQTIYDVNPPDLELQPFLPSEIGNHQGSNHKHDQPR